MVQDELLSLFPIPVLVCQYPNSFEQELEHVHSLKFRAENQETQGNNIFHYKQRSEDTFVLDDPKLSNIREFIELKLQKFVQEVMNSTDELVITQSWVNKSGKGESHHEHVHPNSLVSGVWYPVMNPQHPPIHFYSRAQRTVSLQCESGNNFNSDTYFLPPLAGDLIIFPSHLAHSVPVNHTEEERISLSFNTWVKGSLGGIDSLNYLPLDRCLSSHRANT